MTIESNRSGEEVLCEICKQKPAVVHAMVVQNGQMRYRDLCQRCHEGTSRVGPNSISELLEQLQGGDDETDRKKRAK